MVFGPLRTIFKKVAEGSENRTKVLQSLSSYESTKVLSYESIYFRKYFRTKVHRKYFRRPTSVSWNMHRQEIDRHINYHTHNKQLNTFEVLPEVPSQGLAAYEVSYESTFVSTKVFPKQNILSFEGKKCTKVLSYESTKVRKYFRNICTFVLHVHVRVARGIFYQREDRCLERILRG